MPDIRAGVGRHASTGRKLLLSLSCRAQGCGDSEQPAQVHSFMVIICMYVPGSGRK